MLTPVSRLRIAALVCGVALFSTGCSQPTVTDKAGLHYPNSQRIDQSDDYFGTSVADPYRWLEDEYSPQVADWVAQQNSVSKPFLAAIPAREAIKQRITELWDYERFGTPFKRGGRYFYSSNDGLQNQSVIYVRETLEGEGRVLLDPNRFSADATIALQRYRVSPAGNYVVYGTSDGGSDWTDFRVREVASGKDTADQLTHTKFTSPSWLPDESGFYYSRYPLNEAGEADDSQQTAVYFHRLGQSQAEDQLVYQVADHPTRVADATVTEDGAYLVLGIFDGYASNGSYYQRLNAAQAPVVRLLDQWDGLYNFLGNRGQQFYYKTTAGAPLGKIVRIDLDKPARQDWVTVVPEGEQTMESAEFVGDRLVVSYLRRARSEVSIFALDGRLQEVLTLPGIGSVNGFAGDSRDSETFYSFSSYTTPTTVYRLDLASGESSLFKASKFPADTSPYQVKQVDYKSADGTPVSMFLVHKKGLKLDGNNPTLLYGYGGFNVALTPYFSIARFTWLEMGGVLAIANLRGGSEYGEAWHEAGTKLNKQNVFDDFIAAAQWLQTQGYTSAQKLAVQGGSNGGLLVGAVINQRPELFAAALPAVGVMDMLRYHTASANARQWSSDYGLSENEEQFKALYAYSPVHNTRSGVCYPATLITTADHDDRVVPWHSFKYAAALQHDQACDNPVLLRVETRAGHGAGKPTWMRIDAYADQWAFLSRELGM